MKTIELQLNDYFELQEELHPGISPEEVVGSPVRVSTSTRPSTAIWWAGAAAAIVVLAIGGVALWSSLRVGEVATTDPSVTTTVQGLTDVESVTTTLVDAEESEAVDTTVPSRPDSAYQAMTPPEASGSTSIPIDGFGVFTWTQYQSAGLSFPPSGDIMFDPDIGYVAYPQFNSDDPASDGVQYEWRSDDAVVWERRPLPEFDDYAYAVVDSGWNSPNSRLGLWAQAGTDESSSLLLASGDTWKSVSFNDVDRPEPDGVVFEILWGNPISSGDTTIYASSGIARVPWEQYFGTGSRDSLRAEVGEANEQVSVIDDATDDVYAVMGIRIDGDRVSFVDASTGEIVHEATAVDGFPVESVIEAAQGKRQGDLWVYDGDRRLDWTPNPLPSADFDWGVPIVPLPSGGFLAYIDNGKTVEMWTTDDGITWQNQGLTTLLDGVGNFNSLDISESAGALEANLTIGDPGTIRRWESVDGFNWTPITFPSPSQYGANLGRTSFGWVAAEIDPGSGDVVFWASTDRGAWESLGPPPGFNHDDWRIDGGEGFGAVGEILYFALTSDGGYANIRGEDVDPNGQWIWVGTLEDPGG